MAKTPRRSKRIPKHRLHATGQGVVTLGGKDFYTGVHGTAKSEQRYRELIAEWMAKGGVAPTLTKRTDADAAAQGPSVAEIVVKFLAWARSTYRDDDGEGREELRTLERSAKLLVPKCYSGIPAATFGRKHYFEIRDQLIQEKRARGTINNRLSRVKAIFSWAADRELIPFEVAARLKSIKNLKAGEQGVRERPTVQPVDEATVEKTLPFLRPQLRDFIKLLRLTGARCGELCILRPCDLQPTEEKEVVVYRPSKHKNQGRQQTREIFIGPKALAILKPRLKGVGAEAYVFHKMKSKAPLISNDVNNAVRKAINRAAKSKVIIQPWHPHRLRHSRLTEERREGGIDAAQLIGGHSSATMTQRYASPDASKAIAAAKERG